MEHQWRCTVAAAVGVAVVVAAVVEAAAVVPAVASAVADIADPYRRQHHRAWRSPETRAPIWSDGAVVVATPNADGQPPLPWLHRTAGHRGSRGHAAAAAAVGGAAVAAIADAAAAAAAGSGAGRRDWPNDGATGADWRVGFE